MTMRIKDATVGSMIVPDGGFPCLPPNVPVEVQVDRFGERYVQCHGMTGGHPFGHKHYLMGSMDGGDLIGFTLPAQKQPYSLEDAVAHWKTGRNGFSTSPHEAFVAGFMQGYIAAEHKIPQAANSVALRVLEALIEVPATSNGAIAALKQAIHEIKNGTL